MSDISDFDFFIGEWRVSHRRLKQRLADCTEWEEFGGAASVRKTLSGHPSDLGAPMLGGFANGKGAFFADDVLNDRPIRVRFLWSAGASPRWEQAFSPDGGASWETNWIMNFIRA